ncbi:MAG: glucosaminidase domain-containing protein [Ginsengibacter sp.]
MKKTFLLIAGSLLLSSTLPAQYTTVAQYVDEYKDIAIREMKRMGVPAAITLAQGILETENGNSDLVKKSNNHFGIKCKSNWTGDVVDHDDDAPGECFRAYKDAEESFRDHSNFLRGSGRYAALFKLDPSDYKAWAYGLRKAGYATNPRYPQILIKNIEDNNLQQYTLAAADDVPEFDGSKYKDDKEPPFLNLDATDSASQPAVIIDGYLSVPVATTINGSKALMVPKGTSLLAIATQNNIDLAKLLEINELKSDGLLEKNQLIFLEKKQKEGDHDFYIANDNETLYDIAQTNGVLLQSLCDYNNLRPDATVYAGTKILLRPARGTTFSHGSNYNRGREIAAIKKHEVQPKEGLYAISKKYGVSVSQLKEWNHLRDDNIAPGQQLIILK